MSDALTYLAKARPEAMGHYFAFLKDAGRHLDPKTRALISVITKVHAQTERGFRQYLKRALADGCAPAEVLDALLMAFPALGLAKIVWAVDVLLAMKLPGFELESLAAGAPAWRDLGAEDEFAAQGARRVEQGGRGVFVARGADGSLRVWDGRCPHQGTDMPQDAAEDGRLACPRHGWEFDLETGACVANGDKPLRRLESRIVDGRLQALW
jgi:nitrite reductase/ring-hydroxylating ferredoxin subunit/alkylhydroperoxidase/carboxymuconolactone decarboxylase family protein YurZ